MFFVCFIDIFTIYKRLCNNNYILYHRSQYTSSNTSIHELTQHSSPYIKTSWYTKHGTIYTVIRALSIQTKLLCDKRATLYINIVRIEISSCMRNFKIQSYVATFIVNQKPSSFSKNKLIEGSFFILSQILVLSLQSFSNSLYFHNNANNKKESVQYSSV